MNYSMLRVMWAAGGYKKWPWDAYTTPYKWSQIHTRNFSESFNNDGGDLYASE